MSCRRVGRIRFVGGLERGKDGVIQFFDSGDKFDMF